MIYIFIKMQQKKYSLFSINFLVETSLCCDAFETFKFVVFLRTSSYCTIIKENILSGSILLLIITIFEWYFYLFIAFNTGSSVFWKSILQLWLFGIFKLGTILTKKLLNISATFSSSDITFSEGSAELSLYLFWSKLLLI